MRIITWNINSVRLRINSLKRIVKKFNPDILCLQETKQTNDKFPHDEFKSLNWFSYHNGQKTYNGVAILNFRRYMWPLHFMCLQVCKPCF